MWVIVSRQTEEKRFEEFLWTLKHAAADVSWSGPQSLQDTGHLTVSVLKQNNFNFVTWNVATNTLAKAPVLNKTALWNNQPTYNGHIEDNLSLKTRKET